MSNTSTTNLATPSSTRYQSFAEFYPFYLSQHSNPICRILHVVGTFSAASTGGYLLYKKKYQLALPSMLLIGYGLAWIGHFFFEKNRPATFTYPLWSFMGDWKMMFEVLTFQRGLKD
ncbi:predicted protein [Naegleria gruberi]|uniref:Predicted protein n=1 Tax=Naegleria gruberi TaxID=5762 RepID=D2W081_NAEGR|nr:uncharacterized protein NAEGRDRAFT_74764 [Naegleria gruberi]EFC37527.1 predicted protein [Naegleria gruberi]|eukprot:XP_002670271.1 predicted protein [Naegleria gruberi strain NEG-M]